jgi:hypothetical protein
MGIRLLLKLQFGVEFFFFFFIFWRHHCRVKYQLALPSARRPEWLAGREFSPSWTAVKVRNEIDSSIQVSGLLSFVSAATPGRPGPAEELPPIVASPHFLMREQDPPLPLCSTTARNGQNGETFRPFPEELDGNF